ncbi:hypothetical protein ABPG74_011148 [Tetrahymena malaccensis]
MSTSDYYYCYLGGKNKQNNKKKRSTSQNPDQEQPRVQHYHDTIITIPDQSPPGQQIQQEQVSNVDSISTNKETDQQQIQTIEQQQDSQFINKDTYQQLQLASSLQNQSDNFFQFNSNSQKLDDFKTQNKTYTNENEKKTMEQSKISGQILTNSLPQHQLSSSLQNQSNLDYSFQLSIDQQNFYDSKIKNKIQSTEDQKSVSYQSIRDVVADFQLNKVAYNILKQNLNNQQGQVQQIKFEYKISKKKILKLKFSYRGFSYKMYAKISNMNSCQNYLYDKLEKCQKLYNDNDYRVVCSERIQKDILEYLIIDITEKKHEVYEELQKLLTTVKKN